jgi:hypothetical protein
MANLASMYGNQGQWKGAEELEVQVTETRKRAGCGASFHTDQHEQSCVHMERSGSGQGGYHADERKYAAKGTCVLRLDHPLTSSRVVLNRWECENFKSVSLSFRESLTLMAVLGKMHRCPIDTIFYVSYYKLLTGRMIIEPVRRPKYRRSYVGAR